MGDGCFDGVGTGNDQMRVPPSTEMVPGTSDERSSSRTPAPVVASCDAVMVFKAPPKALTSRVRASVSGTAVARSSRRGRPDFDMDSE